MASKEYDKILYRLIHILTRLNSGEKLHLKSLSDDFGVGIRTLQKDMNERLYMFPILSDRNGNYWFEKGYSLKESELDTQEMLIIALSLMPLQQSEHLARLGEKVLKKLISRNIPNPFYIKPEGIEDIDIDSHLINRLEEAINGQWIVALQNSGQPAIVEPYKIVNFDGIWYLFARDTQDRKIKTWLISRIKEVSIHDRRHNTDMKQVEQMLEHTHTAWFEDGGSFQVVVKVMPEIAHYFELRNFLSSQKILDKHHDGTLVISFHVTNDEDVDNLIKSWLPHIQVIEPQHFKQKIADELREYLQNLEDDGCASQNEPRHSDSNNIV